MNSSQADRELEVFGRFISIARLPINPGSVQKCEPPAPDILCHRGTDGPIAFELTELIDHGFSTRFGQQCTTQQVLETIHEQLPADNKSAFDQQFRNAEIYFSFHPNATKNKVRGNVADVFDDLLALPDGFEGDVNRFASKLVAKIVKSVSISRGGFNGPIFSVENIGGVGDPVVSGIQKKLTKTYQSEHPIELLAYLDVAGMDPPQIWQGPTNRFFANLSDLGPFRRIWVVNLFDASVIAHPPHNQLANHLAPAPGTTGVSPRRRQ